GSPARHSSLSVAGLMARPTTGSSEVLEGHAPVGEPGAVDVGADHPADVVDGVPVVDVHAGHDSPTPLPPGGELTAVVPTGPTAHDDVVEALGAGVADVLHAQVVLVGEEVGERVVLGRVAEEVLGDDLA